MGGILPLGGHSGETTEGQEALKELRKRKHVLSRANLMREGGRKVGREGEREKEERRGGKGREGKWE